MLWGYGVPSWNRKIRMKPSTLPSPLLWNVHTPRCVEFLAPFRRALYFGAEHTWYCRRGLSTGLVILAPHVDTHDSVYVAFLSHPVPAPPPDSRIGRWKNRSRPPCPCASNETRCSGYRPSICGSSCPPRRKGMGCRTRATPISLALLRQLSLNDTVAL